MIDQNLMKTNGHSAASREFNRNGRKGREDKAAKGRKKLGVQSFFFAFFASFAVKIWLKAEC
jgi:hypothetical protein